MVFTDNRIKCTAQSEGGEPLQCELKQTDLNTFYLRIKRTSCEKEISIPTERSDDLNPQKKRKIATGL